MAKLYIICGHGGNPYDSGAVGHSYQEAERVRTLAKRIKALGGSEVEVLDTSRNWYADGGINSLSLPKDACLLELHLDSASASARGGHVIIYGGYEPDEYDNALAKFISGYFPGRSVTISKRTDLANPNRAANRGINYRLLECCFISNYEDLSKFNENMDEVAKGILGAFGIGVKAEVKKEEPEKKEEAKVEAKKSIAQLVKEVLAGKWGNGAARKKALENAGYSYAQVQNAVNKELGASSYQTVDIDDLARRTINGEFGNGEARKKALGSNYAAVQKRVNEMLS